MKHAEQRSRKRLCKACGRHWARFRYHGQVRWDRDHDLCPRCWRAMLDQARNQAWHQAAWMEQAA